MKGGIERFAIRRIRKPRLSHGLHSTVLVQRDGAWYYVDIAFNHVFLLFVGRCLPQGVSPAYPAHLLARFDSRKGQWVLSARYIASQQEFHLWDMAATPPWLQRLQRIDDRKGNHHGNHAHPAPQPEGAGTGPDRLTHPENPAGTDPAGGRPEPG